jgi:hypothetical protein
VTAVSIQSLPSSTRDAAQLAARLGIPCHEIAIHRFPDEEIRVTATPASPVTIIYASLDRPNEKLIALTLAAEALRRGGAKRIVLLAPYLCYMRQDTAFHEGEAISQKAIGALIAGCVDRVITVDAHLHRTADIAAVFRGSLPTICRPCRQSPSHCAKPALIPQPWWWDRMLNRNPGSAISPAGSGSLIRWRERLGAAIAPSKSDFRT